MDKKLESANAEKVKRKVANLLKEYGFKRTKPTFYTKVLSDRVEFVHLHKFTFSPLFRAHIGIRFLCDTFEAVALNGPDSDSYRFKNKHISMSYSKEEDTLDRCSNEIVIYVKDIGFKWLNCWKDVDRLLTSSDSPLHVSMKEKYKMMMNGIIDAQTCQESFRLLGIKMNNVSQP